MFKWIALAVTLGFAWWHFVGNTKVSEEDVRDYYLEAKNAMQGREAEKMCALLHEDFEGRAFLSVGTKVTARSENKETSCSGYKKLFSDLSNAEAGTDNYYPLSHRFWIHSIEISPDQKTATVDISEATDIGGALVQMRSRATETLVRYHGQVMILKSEGRASAEGLALGR